MKKKISRQKLESKVIELKKEGCMLDYIIAQTGLRKKVIDKLWRRFKTNGTTKSLKSNHRLKWSVEHVKYLQQIMKIKGNWFCTAEELCQKMKRHFSKPNSFFRPSTTFGPVHPLGDLKTIIGHRGLVVSLLFLAYFWIFRISSTAFSMTAAMSWCIISGSSPSTK